MEAKRFLVATDPDYYQGEAEGGKEGRRGDKREKRKEHD